jgi:rhodanese-related sulfurtransferase
MEFTVPEISVKELAQRMEHGRPVLIDVRNPGEYERGHIVGARLIPLPELPEHLAELPTNGEVLVVCASGNRSHTASEFLRAHGVQAINVMGGTRAWIEHGYAVETGGA